MSTRGSEAGTEVLDRVDAPTPDRTPTRRRLPRLPAGARVPALAVVCVGLAAVAGVAGYRTWEHARGDHARTEAVAAAERLVPDMLSYDSASLDSDVARAKDATTGSFRDEFGHLVDTVVAPAARQNPLSAKATVSASGVVDASADQATVLLFLTQTTHNGAAGTDTPDQVRVSRVKITMADTADGWRVSGMNPV